jgi:aspartate aminotransferase-like enzyme
MGDADVFDMITVIAGLEMTLADLGYPVKTGEGTRAATEVARGLQSR